MNQDQKNLANKMFENFKSKEVNYSDLQRAEKKANNLGNRINDFKLLLSMFKDGISGKYSVSNKHLAIIGGAILYVVSPIDAIPDVIPAIGWVDDIGVVGLALSALGAALQQYKTMRK